MVQGTGRRVGLLAAICLGATGAVSTAGAQTIRGTATVRDAAPLPPGAAFEALLEDVSRPGASVLVVGYVRVDPAGASPIAFQLSYDPARIQPDRKYAVRGRIVSGDALLFVSETPAAVAMPGGGSVSLTLRRVGGAAAPGRASLAGTSWRFVRFQGGDGRVVTPDDPAKYTLQFAAGGRASVRFDCNRGSGTWKSAGAGQVAFGPLALTRAMCGPPSLHDQFVKHWSSIRSYVVKDGRLFLSLMADGGIYEFEPVK